jgi:hypothetical protein
MYMTTVWADDLLDRPGPNLTIDQAREVFGLLRGQFTWSIDSSFLTIAGRGNAALVFKAA